MLTPSTSCIFEMINITTNLLKYSKENFFKGIKLHRKLIQKINCIEKSLKIFFLYYFRCWSVLSPFDHFHLRNIKSMKMHARNFTRNRKKSECECLLFNTNTAGISWRENVNFQWDYESQEEEKSDTKLNYFFFKIHFDPLYYEISKSHRNISPFSIKRNSIMNTKKTYSKLVEK